MAREALRKSVHGNSLLSVYLFVLSLRCIVCLCLCRATLRYNYQAHGLSNEHLQQIQRAFIINTAWLCTFCSLPLSYFLYHLFVYFTPSTFSSSDQRTDYSAALAYYAVAAIIEMVCEPLYVYYAKQQQIRVRVSVESFATMCKCIITFATLLYAGHDNARNTSGLYCFAYGQLAYAIMLCVGYYAHTMYQFNRSSVLTPPSLSVVGEMFPSRVVLPNNHAAIFDYSLIAPILYFSYQSLQKLLLTEGEKLVLVSISSDLDSQGVYALVQNVASLVARLLLQPIEEATNMEFSLLFAPMLNHPSSPADDSSNLYEEAQPMLGSLIHVVLLLGLLLVCFGPAYSYVFILLVYGVKWSITAAPFILGIYCVYTLFMAINGVTEAFLLAVIRTSQLTAYNVYLLASTAVYLFVCTLLLPLYGTIGLIFANMINMLSRIVYSCLFIRKFFHHNSYHNNLVWRTALPHPFTWCAMISSACITQASAWFLNIQHSQQIGAIGTHIGVSCMAVDIHTLWVIGHQFDLELLLFV